MQVDFQPSATAQQPRQAEASDAASVDFQSFLRLLTAQLRNQDPLSPLDSTQFVAQLASFSTVEQLVSANARLDALGDSLSSSGLGDYADWIGRMGEISGLPALYDGAPLAVSVEPQAGAISTDIIVRNTSGVEVDRFPASPGGVSVWPGSAAEPGAFYRFEAAHAFADGSVVSAPAATFAVIDAVRRTSDGVILDLANGLSAPPSAVIGLRR
jgi:flagellar basal-body rod modification protein FlgD